MRDAKFYLPGTPYTKEDVRAVLMQRLELAETDIVYDLGAGSGTITVEAALQAKLGRVYSFEQDLGRVGVVEENIRRFGLSNVEVIPARFPVSGDGWPRPDKIVVGGSGDLEEVLAGAVQVLKKGGILAGLAVTIENLALYHRFLQQGIFTDYEGVQVQAAPIRKLGHYHNLAGQNPVWIFTARLKEGK